MLASRSFALLVCALLALVVVAAASTAGGTSAPNPASSAHAGPAGASPPYEDAVYFDTPLAYWRLGESRGASTAADASGNGAAATYRNVALGEPGALYDDPNTAARFSGSNGLDVGDRFDFAGRQPFTLEAWMSPRQVRDYAWHMLFHKEANDATGRQGYMLWVSRDPAARTIWIALERFRDGGADNVRYVVPESGFRLRRWHHVAATYDGGVLALYLNGVQVDQRGSVVRELKDTPSSLLVGRASWGGVFDGRLDEVALYGRALTGGEVRRHFAANPVYTSALIDDAPAAYWRLGEQPGATTARDASGNGAHGTYQGVALGQPGAVAHEADASAGFGGAAAVEVGDKLDFPGTAPFTIGTWIYPTAVSDNAWHMILEKHEWDNEGRQGYMLWLNRDPGSKTIEFGAERWRNGARDLVLHAIPEVEFRLRRWYHVAVTHGASRLILYLDGEQVAEAAASRELKDIGSALRIGKQACCAGFPGRLDEVAIFPRALGAREIRNHFAGNAPPSYRRTIEKDEPRGWWRLGDPAGASTAYDASGFEGNGTYGANVAPGAEDALRAEDDGAATFSGTTGDGATDSVRIGDRDELDFGTGDFSVEAWIKTNADPTAEDITIVAKYDGTYPYWELTVTNDAGYFGRLRARVRDATSTFQAYGPSVRIDDGEWHHVIAVIDRDTGVTLYVDRVAAITLGATPQNVTNAAPLQIGAAPNDAPFNGTIDEVAVYATALTPDRVRAHYDAAVGLPAPYAAEVYGDGPNASWRLGEPAGTTTAEDGSDGALDGTYGGNVTPGVRGALMDDYDTAATFHGVDGDGIGDDVKVPDGEFLDVGTEDFSVEAWVKTTLNGERAIIGKSAGSAAGANWHVTVSDDPGYVGRARAKIYDGAATLYAYGPPIRVDDGQWHHVAFVFDRDTGVSAYVDGVEEFTAGAVTGDVSNANELQIGDTENHDPFSGDIDEAALYNALLTPQQVAAHHHAGVTPRLGAAHFRGDYITTPGVVRRLEDGTYQWRIANRHGGTPVQIFSWQSGGTPVVGDWEGDGIDGFGVFVDGRWLLTNGLGGSADIDFSFGAAGDTPVVGDWDGDGDDTPGFRRGNTWYLTNDYSGTTHHSFGFGLSDDKPLAGDWNGDGTDTPGVRRGSTWYLSNDFAGTVHTTVAFGSSGDDPVAGDWNDDGADSLGVGRGAEWFLSDDLNGTVDYAFRYGNASGDTPIVGDWDPEPADTWEGWEDPNGEEAEPQTFELITASPEASAMAAAPVDNAGASIAPVVRRYAPLVYIHPDERYYPGRPLVGFIDWSSLRWAVPHNFDDEREDRGDVRARKLGVQVPWWHRYSLTTNETTPEKEVRFLTSDCTRPDDTGCPRTGERDRHPKARLDTGRGFFLDLEYITPRFGEDNLVRAPTFYHYKARRFITYWFFYPYNHGFGGFNHEGDWERIAIKLNRQNEATQIAYYFHGCHRRYGWDDAVVEKVPGTEHPIVYSANGRHATYWSAGDHDECPETEPIPGSDQTARNDEDGRWETWRNLHSVVRQPWYGFGGAWGVHGSSEHTTGPLGPSRWKRPAPTGW
jgi:hypothetical protein